MPEAGHESVEEDRRGSVSEGLASTSAASSSRAPDAFLQSASELSDKTNCQQEGVNRRNHVPPAPLRENAHRVISNAKKESALSTDRKARPRDCFLHLAARQRQNICSRRLFHQSALAERSAELVTDFAFTTDESIQGVLSV